MKHTSKFGFIIYPEDLERFYSFCGPFQNLIRKIPPIYLKDFFRTFPPMELFRIKIQSLSRKEIEGIFVLCPLLPSQFVSLDNKIVLNRIRDSVVLAKKRGAEIVGLAGFTSIFSNQGLDLIKDVSIPLTTGNTFTAGLAIEGVLQAIALLKYDISNVTLAIIGATGDIGSACAKILSEKVRRSILVARDKSKLLEFRSMLLGSSKSEIVIKNSAVEAAREANVIITCTSSITALLDANDLKSGSILCDISLPANIARDVVNDRNDVFAFEGGYASLPFFDNIKNEGFKKQFKHCAIFGCLAETIILTFEEKFENYSLGRGCITAQKIDEINILAQKNGIKLAPFFCAEKSFQINDITCIKNRTEWNC